MMAVGSRSMLHRVDRVVEVCCDIAVDEHPLKTPNHE